MTAYRVTVTLQGFAPVSKTYRTAEKALRNVAKVVGHPTRPVVTIEPIVITEPGA
jgi:hypothetical protein